MLRTGLAITLLMSVVVAGCGSTRPSAGSVLAADLNAVCKMNTFVPKGHRPSKAAFAAALTAMRRLAAVKPPPSERIAYRKFIVNGAKLDKAFDKLFKTPDEAHFATVSTLAAQMNHEAAQLHASACRIAGL